MKKQLLKISLKKICWFSGLTFIYRKFIPKNKTIPPNGLIWLFGIYFALYGIASQRYENRLDQLETRISSLLTLTGTDAKKNALSQLINIQYWGIPKSPEIFNPLRTFNSLFGKTYINKENFELVKETFLSFKHDLSNMDLTGVNLSGLNLDNANFSGSNLRGADLSFSSLNNANFENSQLHSTNLTFAKIGGANFKNAIIDETLLYGVIIDTLILLDDKIYKVFSSQTDTNKIVSYFHKGLRGVDLDSTEVIVAEEYIYNFLNQAKLAESYFKRFGYAKRKPNGSISHRFNIDNNIIEKSYTILEKYYFTNIDSLKLK